MEVIFFKAFPVISNVSQNGIKILFTIIKHQFDGSEIDFKTSNLSYFNMGFSLNHFLIYHIYHKMFFFTIIKCQLMQI